FPFLGGGGEIAAARDHRQRPDPRRNRHGAAASQAARLRRAVPSRIDPHPRRTDAARELSRGGSVTLLQAIQSVMEGRSLSREEAGAAIEAMLTGTAPASQMAALLVALRMKGETPAEIASCIDECGIGFLFAPAHHAAMRHVAPVRKELGVRTLFNLLGPLANPAGVRRQVVGVPAPQFVPVLARTLVELGAERAFVVHGHGGLDEISTAGPTLIAETRNGSVRETQVTPEELGVAPAPVEELRGGDAQRNAELLLGVLRGERGGRRS